MRIQVFSEYLQQAQAGNVEFLACPYHNDDAPAIFPLVHLEEEDKIILQCYACDFKMYVGITLYNQILDRLNKLDRK
jgi:hypothetical protein